MIFVKDVVVFQVPENPTRDSVEKEQTRGPVLRIFQAPEDLILNLSEQKVLDVETEEHLLRICLKLAAHETRRRICL